MTEGKKKAALVTGGAARLGAAISLSLARTGHDIALHYNHSEEDAFETQRKIRKFGVECSVFKGDLSDMIFVNELIRASFSSFPHLNVLINSASVFKRVDIRSVKPYEFDEIMAVNFKAPFFLIKEFARFCNGTGSIINMLDTKCKYYQKEYSIYSLSRKLLQELTIMAATEYAPQIRCNGIAPGLVLPQSNYEDDYKEKLENRSLLPGRGSKEEITRAVNYLLQSSFVTGEIICVDGGESIDRGIRTHDNQN